MKRACGGRSGAPLPLAGGGSVPPAALLRRDEGKRNFFPLLSSGFQKGMEPGLGGHGSITEWARVAVCWSATHGGKDGP